MRTWIIIYLEGNRLIQREINGDVWNIVNAISCAGIDTFNIISMTVKPEVRV